LRDPQNELEALFHACLVRLDGPGRDFGSGVWVGPSLVLTCAHVAHRGQVTLSWNYRRMRGFVLDAAPGTPPAKGELWSSPDLSLIDVDDPPAGHPCAWLGDHQVNTSSRLFIIGNAKVWTPEPSPHAANGTYGGPADGGWRFSGDEITRGMSGGPVLDLDNAVVVGLAKASRKENTTMGGLIMPLAALRHEPAGVWQRMWRQHDEYHGGGHSAWPRVADEHVRSTTVSRIPRTVDTREMAELLAALVPVVSLRTLDELAGPSGSERDFPLRALRDVAFQLADAMPRQDEPHPLLRFVLDVAGQCERTVAEPLWRWAERVAHRRDETEQLRRFLTPRRHARPDVESRLVTVQIAPGAQEPDRYLLTVWCQDSDGDRIKLYCDDQAAHRVTDLNAALSRLVKSALRQLRGHALVEFVVPPELFDFDFENLEVGRHSRLGRMCAVVLRDLERHDDLETWEDWRARWRKLRSGAAKTERTSCTDDHDPDEFDMLVRGNPDLATLVLPAPPIRTGADLLGVAIYAGVPVAVWPRNPCPDHDPPGPGTPRCSGQAFQDEFENHRHDQHTVPLPALVKALRVGRDARCRELVLLWDDPDRVPDHDMELVEPQQMPTRGGA
jgi:vWA-MoxR associated protein C-terminal domain/Trypsin-like peptidase domain/vWA-MoxR associated protein middle region 0